MRNRIFATEAGITPSILTFNARTDLAERREILLDRRLLLEQIQTPNIYEYFRDHGWADSSNEGTELTDLGAYKTDEEFYPNGRPWRVTYRITEQKQTVYDYLRADGTPYLRIPGFRFSKPSTWPTQIEQVGPDGSVVGKFNSVGQWFRKWIRELTAEERAFVFIDSRYSAQHIVPMMAPNIHLVYLLHNIHLQPPRRWDSELSSDIYRRLLARIGGMDAMVTLTSRQRDDIAKRRGRTDNLFVVPNPVDLPDVGGHAQERDPNLITVVARLEGQKRLDHAVAAFERVLRSVPTARMDIYGEGRQRSLLEKEIHNRGLEGAVTLKGHDPHARDALWTSSVFLMTSRFEGYPLSTLESMSHGCPVVSYDIKYGPREQITDGVDGFVVREGDVAGMADRVVELLTSPDLVRRMSSAAVEKAKSHGRETFVKDWSEVLHAAIELKPHRTRIEKAHLEIRRIRFFRSGFLKSRLLSSDGFLPTELDANSQLRIEGIFHLKGHSANSTLRSAKLSLAAIDSESGATVDVPMTAKLRGDRFYIRSSVPVSQIFAGRTGSRDVKLRFRFVWHNSTWQTFVGRPDSRSPEIEVTYAKDNTLRLSRR